MAVSQWLLKSAFWIPLGICTWMALSPSPPEIPVFKVTDVILHAFAFSYLSFAIRLAYENRSLLQTFVVLFGYGLLIELVQSFEPDRTAELKDLLVDVAGIGLGLVLAGFGADPVRNVVRRLFDRRDPANG